LPLERRIILLGGWRIHLVVQPSMPAWRHHGGFRIAVIDHPAPGAAFRIRAALIVDIAELVLADALALAPGVKARAERLAVPPGKELQQEFLHCTPQGRADRQLVALWPRSGRMARARALSSPQSFSLNPTWLWAKPSRS